MKEHKNRSKTVVPLMIYVTPEQSAKVKDFAEKNNMAVSQVAREGLNMRMAGDKDPYNSGFNGGLKEAMKIVRATEGARMMFPSGKSFAQLVCEGIEKFIRENKGN